MKCTSVVDKKWNGALFERVSACGRGDPGAVVAFLPLNLQERKRERESETAMKGEITTKREASNNNK